MANHTIYCILAEVTLPGLPLPIKPDDYRHVVLGGNNHYAAQQQSALLDPC